MLLRRLLLLACLLATAAPALAQYGYHFGRNKIQYEAFDWHVLKTEHFDIFYYPEMQALAEQGAFFAEEAYDDLRHRFQFAFNERVPIIFYSSNLHFKQTNITPGFIPDGVGGFFEFLKGRVVIPANGNLHRFRRVIRHELAHVFTFSKVMRVMRDHRIPPDRLPPLWFTEGLAEYWSGERDYQYEMVMRDAVISNYLVPIENLYRIQGTYVMYKQGEALCAFIAETYGEDKLLELIEQGWKDKLFEKVMEIVLREDLARISDRWQAWARARYYPVLEGADLPTLLAGGVAARGFSSKPAFYARADGARHVYYVGNVDGYSNVFRVPVDTAYQPVDKPEVLVKGERNDRFEAFHLFESRISVSPQGQLAFVTKSGERDVIHVYDLEADALAATYAFDDLVAVYSPTWSPDGHQLAFSSIDASGYSDLYVFDTRTEGLRRLTDDPYDDRDPAWSPDGRRLAFSSDRTAYGQDDAYNLFTYSLDDGQVRYVTYGPWHDLSPQWSPDGRQIVYTSTRRDSTGRYDAQNLWTVDAEAPGVPLAQAGAASAATAPRTMRQLTRLSAAAFDPAWTPDGRLLFSTFEHYRFTIRSLPADSLLAAPRAEVPVRLAHAAPDAPAEPWAFGRIGVEAGGTRAPYRKRYALDIAQGEISQNPVFGTQGGAVMAFSDMLGDDHLYVMVYNSSQRQSDFLRSLNVSLSRVQLHRRANIGYGVYRFGGQRYDRTDPDAASEFPLFWETIWGGFGAVSYPLSQFRRVEMSTSLSWSDKEIDIRGIDREALLLSNAVSLVHDNTLFGLNGPMDGWRANLTLGYTTDLRYSNVSYYTLTGDLRHYWRLWGPVTFASRFTGRINEGREARLFLLGGSWDLRGHRLLSVRGKKMWFTSHELRFPLLEAPSLYLPILAPFGIANLRGALFADAAHAWNEDYHAREPQLGTGTTLGALGGGLRVNLFGAIVLRYDVGYAYTNGFKDRERFFKQFFFGWDF